MSIAELRAEVADALKALWALAPVAYGCSRGLRRLRAVGGTDPKAARNLLAGCACTSEVIEAFLDLNTAIAVDGLAEVPTAGPPAVGKSTRLGELGYDATWRRIDPDVFKVMLIEHDLRRAPSPFLTRSPA